MTSFDHLNSMSDVTDKSSEIPNDHGLANQLTLKDMQKFSGLAPVNTASGFLPDFELSNSPSMTSSNRDGASVAQGGASALEASYPFEAIENTITNLEKDLKTLDKELIGLYGGRTEIGSPAVTTGSGSDSISPPVAANGGSENTPPTAETAGTTDNVSSPATTGGDTTSNNPGATDIAGGITANVNGFFDPTGKPLTLVGLNASPSDALAGFGNVQSDFPGLNAIRLNVDPSGVSDPAIDQAVQQYTNAGIAVELELHGTNGVTSDVSTYSQWARQYKNNNLVMLETPNEPQGNVASDQTAVVEAIKAQGFSNPIGVQPIGGYDQSNVPTLLSNLKNDNVSSSNLYVTPHIYYGGSDPNGALNYAQSEAGSAQQQGLPALIDEYGPATDGYTIDPQGATVNPALRNLEQNGYGTQSTIGSIYWGMDNGNHPDGADSAFLSQDGSQLTPDGQWLQQNTLS